MKVILNNKDKNTINIQDVTENHLVVGIIDNTPCILGKGMSEDDENVIFFTLNNHSDEDGLITSGYGLGIEHSIKEMIKSELENDNLVEVFEPKDWKKALQWLIDNCK